jgi:hypothetical protein
MRVPTLSPLLLLIACSDRLPAKISDEAGAPDASVGLLEAGPPPGLLPDAMRPPLPDLPNGETVLRDDAGTIAFSGGELATGAALPVESAAVPAFRCSEGRNQACINMRQYWPTPADKNMQVKTWEFFDLPGFVSRGPTVYRTQGLFAVPGASGEYRLIDHFNGPYWRTGLALDGSALASWVDTWSLRYDNGTVVEYKDDANANTTFIKPQIPGIAFARSVYDQGHELRWGKRLVGGVDNLSQTYTWTTVFPTNSLTSPRTSRGYADNTFGLVEVRNNVIVAGVRYDNVAIVRVSQRECEPNTSCNPSDAESGSWLVDYFYMAPSVGMIARFAYEPATLDGGAWDMSSGGIRFVMKLLEIMRNTCEKSAPVAQYDWQLAFTDGTLTSSAPAPSCP